MSNEKELILKEISEYTDKQFKKIMIFTSIFILSIVLAFGFFNDLATTIIIFLLVLLLLILPFIVIPVIIRKGLKKIFNKWQAAIYTLFFAFLFVLVTHRISILILIIILIPYYYLQNQPMFTNKKIKDLKQKLKETNN